ncbi:Uma2 family endonuclease [Persicitalea jodogahamensis]|nr:Uma2 family endonuclease [Persicitalea jodogahamensis]
MTMTAQPKQKYSPEEYLQLERAAEYKSEYYRGEIFAMAGASRNHNRIVGNLNGLFYNFLLAKPCNFYPSDMRVHVPANGLYTYPDLLVACGQEEYLDDETDTLLNPKIIIEVLSKSTGSYDRGDKFEMYRSIPTLMEYVLVDSRRVKAEVWRKEEGTWLLAIETNDLESNLELKSIDFTLSLHDVYNNTEGIRFGWD